MAKDSLQAAASATYSNTTGSLKAKSSPHISILQHYNQLSVNNNEPLVQVPASGVQQQQQPLKCKGFAREALKRYRKRVRHLQRKDPPQKKPDMVAFKELHNYYTPPRHHGRLDDVPVGLKVNSRGEAAILGIHQQILKGIDNVKGEACYAICASGGYQDDEDNGKEDGTLIYTGMGGQDKKGRQVRDQSEETSGNASLIQSYTTQLPIRVLRGRVGEDGPEYYYDGLYQCKDYNMVPSKEGPLVLKFTLVPIAHESTEQPSIVVDANSKLGGGRSNGFHVRGEVRNRLLDKANKKRKLEARTEAMDREMRINATRPRGLP